MDSSSSNASRWRLPKVEVAVRAVRREAALRRNVYPRWVGQGRMTQATADQEIAAMENAGRLLAGLQSCPDALARVLAACGKLDTPAQNPAHEYLDDERTIIKESG